jgi:hypothetical protein
MYSKKEDGSIERYTSTAAAASTTEEEEESNTPMLIGIGVAVAVLLAVAVGVMYYRKAKNLAPMPTSPSYEKFKFY